MTTKTATVDTFIKGEIVEPAPLAVIEPTATSMQSLVDYGFVLPIATPEILRQAFAEKQRLLAAILDEHDYIYLVPYTDPVTNRQKQYIASRRADAEKAFEQYQTEILAKPKKSGIVKLAAALNIECRRVKSAGLPEEPGATYAWVLYEATHKRTGRTEEGVGWCDKSEQGGRITIHTLIATADTRAYNRAVLRIAGFGDVSADEIISGGNVIDTTGSSVTSEVNPATRAEPRPANNHEIVVAAARTWAEAIAGREGDRFIPLAQQTTKAFREVRARARRGDLSAAKQLGTLGLHWEGVAQDALEFDTFQVETPPVTVEDVLRVREASAAQKHVADAPAPQPARPVTLTTPAANPAPTATAPATTPTKPTPAHAVPPEEDCITLAQAKQLTDALLKALGTKEAALAWLRDNAKVDTSRHVRHVQFDSLMSQLSQMPKEA